MDKDKLLKLSRDIAKKTRKLIPRSDNRIGEFGPFGLEGSAWDTSGAPDYLYFQLLAQRSRKTVGRRTVYDLNKNTALGYKTEEMDAATNKAFWERAVSEIIKDNDPWVQNTPGTEIKEKINTALREELKAKTRSAKTLHKDRHAVLALEQAEADAKNAVRFRVGNCGECASLAFVMFAEYAEADLPKDEKDRPMVERVEASNPGDHSFIVINRNCTVDIQNVDEWSRNPNTIICDPWWFHEGDAFFPANAHEGANDAGMLVNYIEENSDGLKVLLRARLGCGHSDRFKKKHPKRDFAKDSIHEIQKAFSY
jgi:hypothetical protein